MTPVSWRGSFLNFATRNLFLVILFALYFPFLFFGYGSDNDTYGVLDAGKAFFKTWTYQPSRNPGYLFHETAVYVLNAIGGSILTNGVSLVMGLLSAGCFSSLCRHYDIPGNRILGLTLGIHPLVWINSTSTHDFVWALGFILAGFLSAVKRRYMLTAFLLGLAVGTRLSSLIAVGAVMIYLWTVVTEDRRKMILPFVTIIVLSFSFYLPSFIHAGYSKNFLTPHIQWEYFTPCLRILKFAYKSIYFWSLPGFLFLVMTFIMLFRKKNIRFTEHKDWIPLVYLSLGIIAGYHMLFFKYPIENEYMLPILPFALLLIGMAFVNRAFFLYFFFCVLILYNFININFARVENPGKSKHAEIGVWLEKGYLLDDLQKRILLKHCDSLACWKNVSAGNASLKRAR